MTIQLVSVGLVSIVIKKIQVGNIFMKGFLYQIAGTCWLHCIIYHIIYINLTILSPSSNNVKNYSFIKNTRALTFLEISNASRFMTFQQLIFSLLKNILLKNIQPKPSDENILSPIASRVKGVTHYGSEFI